MGDRYTLVATPEELQVRYGIEHTERHEPRYNAAPTQIMPVLISNGSGLSFFHWGQIPARAKNRAISSKLLYAESETLTARPSSRTNLMTRRCLIPADGYYDWKRISKKGRIPYRWTFHPQPVVSFAGLWEEFTDEKDELFHTFKIITTPANSIVADINHRMPAVLSKPHEEQWLNTKITLEELVSLLRPFPEVSMSNYTVSPKIDDPKNEGPALIRPQAPADQFGNYSLFD